MPEMTSGPMAAPTEYAPPQRPPPHQYTIEIAVQKAAERQAETIGLATALAIAQHRIADLEAELEHLKGNAS